MYKIGEFSSLSKTTIKALRYYEKEKLLTPAFIDLNTGYRYYETNQLGEISKIVMLRKVGMSIKDIKKLNNGKDLYELLEKRKKEIEQELILHKIELSNINYLMEEKSMNKEIIIKELPKYTVYYKEGVLKSITDITEFILSSGEECLKLNPDIKCLEEDYCYVNYLDGEYRESNIKIRYAQAVEKAGKGNEIIKFMEVEPVTAVCLYHQGAYDTLRESYGIIMKYIEDNNYEIIDYPREHYIDGCWNKESVEDWLTEIQVPIKKAN